MGIPVGGKTGVGIDEVEPRRWLGRGAMGVGSVARVSSSGGMAGLMSIGR